MGTYLVNFLIYSMAMVGLLFICLTVYKKTMADGRCIQDRNELSLENALNLSGRKTLYVVKAGKEKFLIAADAERTTFLAKLNDEIVEEKIVSVPVEISQPIVAEKKSVATDYSEVMNTIKMTRKKQPVMREMLRKLDEYSLSTSEDK